MAGDFKVVFSGNPYVGNEEGHLDVSANFTMLVRPATYHLNTPPPLVVSKKCDPIRAELHRLEEAIKLVEKSIIEPHDPNSPKPHDPHMKPVISKEWKDLDLRIRRTRASLQACEESLIPITIGPLTLTLTRFECLDQSDEFNLPIIGNTENDEPYALVFAVDLQIQGSIAVGKDNSKMTLVGPLADVGIGERTAPFNIIWGLNNGPDFISSPDNFIVLVAMMENDDGSASQARTVLEKTAKVSLLANVGLFTDKKIGRQELVSRIVNDMNGFMRGATAGFINFDDNIGPIRELRFSQAELDHIYRDLGPIDKNLTFEGDGARYILKFRMFR